MRIKYSKYCMNVFSALRKMRKIDRLAAAHELATKKMKKSRSLSIHILKRHIRSHSTQEPMHHHSSPNINSNMMAGSWIVNVVSNGTGMPLS